MTDELRVTNGYLALIAEVLQERPPVAEGWGHRPPPPHITVEQTTVEFPQPVVDASELLARWLWLQLPKESKEDMSR